MTDKRADAEAVAEAHGLEYTPLADLLTQRALARL